MHDSEQADVKWGRQVALMFNVLPVWPIEAKQNGPWSLGLLFTELMFIQFCSCSENVSILMLYELFYTHY